MISKLYREISAGLKFVNDCTVYREDVPQDFKVPCFMVVLYDQTSSYGINGRLKTSVRVDIHYFPADNVAYQEECWGIGQKLQKDFRMASFKLKNRNLKITDKVLHFLFDVNYREYLTDDMLVMQTMSQNTKLKE